MSELGEILNRYFVFGAIIAALALGVGHFVPKPRKQVHPIIAHTCGVAIILIGAGVWLGFGLNLWELYAGLWILAFVCGVADVLCYAWDWQLNNGASHYALTKIIQPSGRGGPRTPAQAFRNKLEDIIAHIMGADSHLRFALLKIAQWAQSEEEKEIIDEILSARVCINDAHDGLLEFHPDKVKKEVSNGES